MKNHTLQAQTTLYSRIQVPNLRYYDIGKTGKMKRRVQRLNIGSMKTI